MYATKRREQ